MKEYDVVVMGAGIVGLASALAASKRGLRVAVMEQDSQCVGASIRNFGFVTVTGQREGRHWQRAMRSRQIWSEVSSLAGIDVVHHGTLIPAYRPEAVAVCDAFLQTTMGAECSLVTEREALRLVPAMRLGAACHLWSPHELRVESRTAIPRLAQWLQDRHKVDFYWSTRVLGVELPKVVTSRGDFKTRKFIGCPGHQFSVLPEDIRQQAGISVCTLQMLRLDPGTSSSIYTAVMSDLSLARYDGFADLPAAAELKQVLGNERAGMLAAGVHLIAVRSADGSLVVGDSHVYGGAEAPFASEQVDGLILQAFDEVFDLPQRRVRERWVGSYASAEEVVFSYHPSPDWVVGLVTGGTGASTGFAFGESWSPAY